MKKEWAQDSVIDETNLRGESLRNTELHSKYMNIMSDHYLVLKSLELKYKKEKLFKTEYYSGKLNEDSETLKIRGLEPVRHKIMKSGIEDYLEADSELSDLSIKMILESQVVNYCQEVIKWLKSRSYDIQNAVRYEIFQNGG